MHNPAYAELIVLAAPATHDPYYAGVQDNIFDFHIAYAKTIEQHGDDVLVLTDSTSYDKYVAELGKDKVFIAPMLDIWMRDFSLSNMNSPTLFRYTAAGQGGSQQDADAVQDVFAALIQDANISFSDSDLLDDGGNFVDDYMGNVVISTKFLRDNKLSEKAARERIQSMPGINHVAFIEADEQGGLEHADGIVSFVDTNTLIINSYPEYPAYTRYLKHALKRGLPNVKIHEIVTPYDGRIIYDPRFGSACGLYTNALVTPERIYFPQFGIAEDRLALKQVQQATTREVVPVASHQVCHMGGGVRCMSWQVRGENAAKLLAYIKAQPSAE